MRLSDLGTADLTWRRLGVLVRSLPRESTLAAELHGEAVLWGVAEHLTAAAVDALNAANWQRAGNRNTPRPKPIPRPGAANPNRKVQRYGGGRQLTFDDIDARMAKLRGGDDGSRTRDRVRQPLGVGEGDRGEDPRGTRRTG